MANITLLNEENPASVGSEIIQCLPDILQIDIDKKFNLVNYHGTDPIFTIQCNFFVSAITNDIIIHLLKKKLNYKIQSTDEFVDASCIKMHCILHKINDCECKPMPDENDLSYIEAITTYMTDRPVNVNNQVIGKLKSIKTNNSLIVGIGPEIPFSDTKYFIFTSVFKKKENWEIYETEKEYINHIGHIGKYSFPTKSNIVMNAMTSWIGTFRPPNNSVDDFLLNSTTIFNRNIGNFVRDTCCTYADQIRYETLQIFTNIGDALNTSQIFSVVDRKEDKFSQFSSAISKIMLLMAMNSCSYSFYVVMMILFKLIHTKSFGGDFCEQHNWIENEAIKEQVASMMIEIVEKTPPVMTSYQKWEISKKTMIDMLTKIKNTNCIGEMDLIFGGSKTTIWETYLRTLAQITYAFNNSLHNGIVRSLRTIIKESSEDTEKMEREIVNDLESYLSYQYPTYKIESIGNYCTYNRSTNCFVRESHVKSAVESLYRDRIEELYDLLQTANPTEHSINENNKKRKRNEDSYQMSIAKKAVMQYYRSHTVMDLPINIPPNLYTYFQNTKHGIFNTITGQYMAFCPLLVFTTCKSYGVHVIENEYYLNLKEAMSNSDCFSNPSGCDVSILCENFALSDQIFYTKKIFDEILKNINWLFITTIVLPGIITLSETTKGLSCSEAFFITKNIVTFFLDIKNKKRFKKLIVPIVKMLQTIYNVTELEMKIVGFYSLKNKRNGWNSWDEKDNMNLIKLFKKANENVDECRNIDQLLIKYNDGFEYEHETSHILLDTVVACITKSFYTDPLRDYNVCNPNDDVFNLFWVYEMLSKKYLKISNRYRYEHLCGDAVRKLSEKITERSNSVLYRLFGPRSHIIDIIFTFLSMTNYDKDRFIEFVDVFSNLYRPNNERSAMVIYCGAPRSGKSTINNILLDVSKGSIYTTSNPFDGGLTNDNAPKAADLVKNSSYVILGQEVVKINSNTLKLLTGQDPIMSRGLFENTYTVTTAIGRCFAVCNTPPIITDMDDATADRIIMVTMNVQFVDRRCNDNILLLKTYTQNYGFMSFGSKTFGPLGHSLSTLAYSALEVMKDSEQGRNTPILKCRSSTSLNNIHNLRMENDVYFSYIYNAGYDIKKNGSTDYNNFVSAVRESIIDSFDIKPQARKIDSILSCVISKYAYSVTGFGMVNGICLRESVE